MRTPTPPRSTSVRLHLEDEIDYKLILLPQTLAGLFCLALAATAQAQVLGDGLFGGGSSTYSGPGDVVPSAFAWYGLRAYNGASAAGTVKAVNIRCSSGPSSGSTFDIKVLTTGPLDIATASTDCGTDGSITASIATTVLSITVRGSGQVTIGDQITGTGITNPTYVISAGTCTSGAVVPPCTFNLSQTNSVGSEAITAKAGMAVATWYDQSGAGRDASQATSSKQPLLLTNCVNTSLPCLGYLIANSKFLVNSPSFVGTASTRHTRCRQRANHNYLSGKLSYSRRKLN